MMGATVHDTRRLSVSESYHDVELRIRRAMSMLNDLWDLVHMSEPMRVARISTAFKHISNLLDDMVASEQSMVSRVQEDIKSGMESINCMRSEMDMENWINTKDEAGSIDMLKAIESEIKRLQLLYDEKKKDQQELIDRIDLLAFRLGEDISELIPESKKLIASADVAVLQAKTVQMEGLLNERIKQSQEWQRDMRKYIKVMGDVLIQDDPNLKVIIESDLSKDDFTLHNGMLSLIEGHWMQMRDMFSDWVQEKDFKWTELYGRLKELWNQCHVADIERLFPSSFDPDRHTDKDYNDMAKEIARLEALYAARQSVYDMLKTWKQKWQDKLALEDKRKDSAYYQSRERGHSLMKDAQAERTLNEHTLPKLAKSLIEAYETYLVNHPGDEIKVEGMTPPSYVKWIMDEYNHEKEVERRNKQLQRKQDLASRSGLRTPQSLRKNVLRAPNSCSKLEPVAKRLHFDSTLSPCFSSASSTNLLSIISPTKSVRCGPKHSSPKQSLKNGKVLKKMLAPSPSPRKLPASKTPLRANKKP